MYKLMLVEDEPLIRKGLQKYFDWESLRVNTIIEAVNGKEGLRLSAQENPDIIITDIRMPIMNGLEMIKRIRIKQPEISIIILTGYNEFEYAQKAIQYGGVHDFLLKPLQREKSYQSIKNCINLLDERKQQINLNQPTSSLKNDHLDDASFDLFAEIEAYIIENVHEDTSLNAVASHFYYNPSYLSRLFKAKLEKNFVEFSKEIKIKIAKEHLQNHHFSITEVSRKSGFRSYKNFLKSFRDVTDTTPTEYRRQLR